jgi:hypothetical protein
MKTISELLQQVCTLQNELALHGLFSVDGLDDVAEVLGKARRGLSRRLEMTPADGCDTLGAVLSYVGQQGAAPEVVAILEKALDEAFDAYERVNKNKEQ